jgi:hypothetical protein
VPGDQVIGLKSEGGEKPDKGGLPVNDHVRDGVAAVVLAVSGCRRFEMYAIVCHEFESSENSDISLLRTGRTGWSLLAFSLQSKVVVWNSAPVRLSAIDHRTRKGPGSAAERRLIMRS